MTTTQKLCIAADALDVGDPLKPVSSISMWSDATWRLDVNRRAPASGAGSICWPTEIDARLLESFRRLFWSLLVSPTRGGPRATTYLSAIMHGTKILARWMDEEAYDFEDVGPSLGRRFQDHLTTLAGVATDEDYADDPDGEDLEEQEGETEESDAADGHTRSSLISALRALALIHEQSAVLARLGRVVPPDDPLEGRPAETIANEMRAPTTEREGALPDEVALPLIAAADALVNGGAVLEAAETLEAYQEALNANRERRRETALRRAIASIAGRSFRTLDGEEDPWIWRLAPLGVSERGFEEPMAVWRLFVFAQSVCVLLLAQLTGMRPSELVSLDAGIDEATGLPACVERVTSPGGSLWLFYAVGEVTKGRSRPETERWLLGATPIGSEAVPTTVEAIRLIDRLGRPFRAASEDPDVRSALLLATGRSTEGGMTTCLSPAYLNVLLKRLYPLLLDFAALPETSREGTSLTTYKRRSADGTSATPLLRTSQWRKTFATNLIRIDSTLQAPLRRHFHHFRAATLDGAYVSRDSRLLESVADARTLSVTRIFRDRAEGRTQEIGRASRILERSAGRIAIALETADNGPPGSVERLLEVHAPDAWRGEHADCAFFVAPHRAACHDEARNASYLHDAPDFAHRSPETCVSCPNALLGARHAAYWKTHFRESNAAKRTFSRIPAVGAAETMRTRAAGALVTLRALLRRSASRS